ncbi:MAG: toxin-antitoxin system YwqK family antitoxin [Spirochaetota bacterium]
MKDNSKNRTILFLLFLTLYIRPCTAQTGHDISSAEAERRLRLKKDFVTFVAGWEEKHIKYRADHTYDSETKSLVLYDSGGVIRARGRAEPGEDDIFIRSGQWRRYYADGSLLGIIEYRNNKRNGPATGYYPSGRIAQRSRYRNGSYDGKRIRYDSSGRILDTVMYAGGRPVSYDIAIALVPSFQRPQHLPLGTIYEDTNGVWVHRDRKNNFISMWYRNGSLLCEIYGLHAGEKDETLHGKAVYWYESGGRWMEGFYSKGKPSGEWKYFTEDGSLRERRKIDSTYIFDDKSINNTTLP